MKSTLSKLQIKMLLDGKMLSIGRKKIYISKDDQIYEILSEAYHDKYQFRKIILDTNDKGFISDANWRISWTKSNNVDYTGEYKFADKDIICQLTRTEEIENGYVWVLYVRNKENLEQHLISAFKWSNTDPEDQMLKVAEYGLLCEFRKADNDGIDFNDYMKEF